MCMEWQSHSMRDLTEHREDSTIADGCDVKVPGEKLMK